MKDFLGTLTNYTPFKNFSSLLNSKKDNSNCSTLLLLVGKAPYLVAYDTHTHTK